MIPSPSIAPAAPQGSTFRGEYNGAVVALGVNTPLNISLMYLPREVRSQPYFKKQFQLTVKSLDANLTNVSPAVLADANFFDDGEEPNAYVQVLVSAVAGTEQVQVIATLPHSIVR